MSLPEALKNSKGKIFYGLHFCPGVAQYDMPDGSFKIFINEQTIRKMNPTMAGRPMFVEHVDEVEDDLSQLRNEADGWVIESFYNEADGKTWAKFIIVSDRGFAALRAGYRLSNAYIPQLADQVGDWNGVTYQKLVVDGEFEHLAIVKNPRYDESVIMTPDEFKVYNENLKVELKRLANSKDTQRETKMKFNWSKKTKVENSKEVGDIESLVVELPKSKKEMTVAQLVNAHDAILNMNGYANGDHMVKVGDKDEMSVNDLVKKHMETCNELDGLKAKNAAGEDGGEPGHGEDDLDPEVANADDTGEEPPVSMDNEDLVEEVGRQDGAEARDGGDQSIHSKMSKTDKKISPDAARKSLSNADRAKADVAKAKATALKNAHLTAQSNMEAVKVDLVEDQVARGKSRYGSN